jgi:hypothetical protein
MVIYSGFTNQKWLFSIAMLVYQRVYLPIHLFEGHYLLKKKTARQPHVGGPFWWPCTLAWVPTALPGRGIHRWLLSIYSHLSSTNIYHLEIYNHIIILMFIYNYNHLWLNLESSISKKSPNLYLRTLRCGERSRERSCWAIYIHKFSWASWSCVAGVSRSFPVSIFYGIRMLDC